MEVKFNVTGGRRKELVKVISEVTGARAEYKFMPTCSYEIGIFTVTKDGTLVFDDRSDSEMVEKVLEGLAQAGFESEQSAVSAEEMADAAQETEATVNSAETKTAPQGETVGLTVAVPRDSLSDAAIENLQKIVDSKAALIKKALGTDALPIKVDDEKVTFPWFTEMEGDAATAYTHLVSALCEMSRNAKRVTATEKEVDNEKYAFRCFLLRLGFIGAEYKTERKILLRNLSGSSAFKSGHKGGVDDAVSE